MISGEYNYWSENDIKNISATIQKQRKFTFSYSPEKISIS